MNTREWEFCVGSLWGGSKRWSVLKRYKKEQMLIEGLRCPCRFNMSHVLKPTKKKNRTWRVDIHLNLPCQLTDHPTHRFPPKFRITVHRRCRVAAVASLPRRKLKFLSLAPLACGIRPPPQATPNATLQAKALLAVPPDRENTARLPTHFVGDHFSINYHWVIIGNFTA